MKHNPAHSDLRVCASREPKAERRDMVPDQYRVFSRSTKTGNVLSTTESQGLRKTKGFGPKSSETGANSFGKWPLEPEGHFVLECPAERREQRDSWKVMP
jgi:hypothetical protein